MNQIPLKGNSYEDFVRIKQSLCKFAVIMLSQYGEFLPFAEAIKPDGTQVAIGGDIGVEKPKSAELGQFLRDALVQSLKAAQYRSFGLCMNVSTIPPGEKNKVDALSVLFADSKSWLIYFIPYQIKQGTVSLSPGFCGRFKADA